MSEWRETTLGDLCDEGDGDIRTGPFGSQLHEADYSEFGIPVIMPKDIATGRVDEASIARVGLDHVQRLSQHKLSVGDIVYGRRGDIGRKALITEREAGWLCGTGCLRVTVGAGADPRFLFYRLGEPDTVTAIRNRAVGATMPNLNTTILREVALTVPPIETQRRIAGILGAYDDLIEVNRRRVAVLEDMARGLFEEWFVRLRFPGHESVPLHNTPDGPLPEGWRWGELGEQIELAYGKALKATERQPGPYPVIGSSGIVGEHCEAYERGPGIVVGRKGNVGAIIWSPDDFWPIDTVFFVRSASPQMYLLQLLQRVPFQNTDAAVPGLNRSAALKKVVRIPPARLEQEYHRLVWPMRQMVDELTRSNQRLAASRDLLLPRLMSGGLSVAEAQKELEIA